MYRSQMVPSDRFFARLHRFECECPSCGRVINTWGETARRRLPKRMEDTSRQRTIAKHHPGNTSIKKLVFNPHLQLLRCPHCSTTFTCGLVLYPPRRGKPLGDAPPDTVPTRRQRMEMMAAHGGGWLALRRYAEGDDVNVVVTRTCSCPHDEWSRDCPLHGAHLHPELHTPVPKP